MISTYISKYSKRVAGVLLWLLTANIILPVFAYAGAGHTIAASPYPSRFPRAFSFPKMQDNDSLGNQQPYKDERRAKRKVDTREMILNSQGPSQPEVSSFKSVGVENMVDPFSGDFSYNIPLLDVGGYPVGIHYNSNITMDQEASWVGLGWNLNPGTVSRNMRGLPDDFNGVDSIKKTVHTKPAVNLGINVGAGVEVFGFGLDMNTGLSYDSYKGYGIESGVGMKATISRASRANGGKLAGTLSFSNSSTSGLGVSAGLSYSARMSNSQKSSEHGTSNSLSGSLNYSSRAGLTSLSIDAESTSKWQNRNKGTSGASFSIPASMTFSRPSFTPGTEIPYTSVNTSFNFRYGASFYGIFLNGKASAQMGVQFIAPKDTANYFPAYGYLHFSKSVGNERALLDYNRENDGLFVDKITPAIAIPQYTYDVYSISAEGTGGSFRPYRSDIGYVYTANNQTKSGQLNAGLDLGVSHIGINIKPVYSYTVTKAWNADNLLRNKINFQKKDSIFEDVVFRNPMEMPIQSAQYLASIGHDTLARPVLDGDGSGTMLGSSISLMPDGLRTARTISLTKPVFKEKREKRNQVISYLNAADASFWGLNRKILSYRSDYLPYIDCTPAVDTIARVDGGTRKPHHISEVTVLNDDGRRYVYGIPAYTTDQVNMTFAVKPSVIDDSKKLCSYTSKEASPNNTSGVDGYFSSEKIPGYAHSFLLSGILSSDYVDVNGDGISDDDIGDAVKFNYTRVYGADNDRFGWRTPTDYQKASYQPGLKTYSRDDKASIVRGEKEIWYLHSIVSKTMVAVFQTSSKRPDAMSQVGTDGQIETTKQLKRLDKIYLYTKASLVKDGAAAKPVKTVHFEYDFSLCRNPANNDSGKLTLKRIYYTYNGNKGKKSNPYVFTYNSGSGNPSYHIGKSDAWGNYKDPAANPLAISNADYPYVVQDKQIADQNASAWCLTDISLPSRGNIKVTYESDDYGYVQDHRATQFFKIAGFAKGKYDAPENKLYPDRGIGASYDYLIVDVPSPVYSKQDIYSKYLQGIGQLYLKLSVNVPGDQWGTGSEFIPVICEIEPEGDNYGQVSSSRIYIKIKRIGDSPKKTPMEHYVLQFLRENLPSKAYPGSETGNDPDLKTMINVIGSQAGNITTAVLGFDKAAKLSNMCREINTGKSFVKLCNPTLTKLGGGLRVKKVELFDNFNDMTGNNMVEASYGQSYDYTTTAQIIEAGVLKTVTISSGVATNEPFVGGEENALKGYYTYQQQMNALGPVNYMFVDTPFCESLYPGASVGYSKVTIKTINKEYLSSNGKEVYQYYTYKDFPTRWSFTPFDEKSRKRYQPKISNFLKLNAKHYLTLSQGFKVELNDMHGKLKSHGFYSETDPNTPVTYTENFYRTKTDMGQRTTLDGKVWATDGPEKAINMSAAMGQGVELMTDLREQSGFTGSANMEFNTDLIILLITVPAPSFYIWPQWEKTRFRSASMLKVVNNYGILDSVYQLDKGSVVATKNLVFDSETGNVLLNRTNNEFKDPIYNFNYPARWAYSGMGMAYKNIDAEFGHTTGLFAKWGRLYDVSNNAFPMEQYFESGDECIVTNTLGIASKAWVLDSKKGTASAPKLFLIDRDGKPVHNTGVRIKVIRSGYRNLLGNTVGSVTMLSNPIENVSGSQVIKINDSKKVVSTTAASFKDCWKVENHQYVKDTSKRVLVAVNNLVLNGTPTLAKRRTDYNSSNNSVLSVVDSYLTRADTVSGYDVKPIASHDVVSVACQRRYDFKTKTIIRFDLSQIPDSSVIDSASLALESRSPGNIWVDEAYNACNELTGYYNSFNSPNWYASGTSWNDNSHRTILKRFTWNYSFNQNYDALDLLTSNDNSVILNSSSDSTRFNVTNLIQDMVIDRSGDGNIMMKLEGSSLATHGNPVYMSFEDLYSGGKCPSPNVCAGIKLAVDYHFYDDSLFSVCRKYLTDTTNPYRWGVYGNWRPERSFVFYGDRKESSPSQQTNLRTDGTINAFVPYWEVGAIGKSVIKPTIDTTKWVWNASTTLVNKRGLEVENVDALKRYSSGHYGYNESLPVDVVQNAMYRQSASDGFEDYLYKDQYCSVLCPNPRFADFTKFSTGTGQLSTEAAHTGLYSLKFNNSASGTVEFPLYDSTNDITNQCFPCATCGVTTTVTVDSLRKTSVDTSFVLPLFSPIKNTGAFIVSAWVKVNQTCEGMTIGNALVKIGFDQGATDVSLTPTGVPIEGWQRVEATITNIPQAATKLKVLFIDGGSGGTYVDDIRIHPFNAGMKSFIYNAFNLRLMAELDENNYASYYEYDEDGSLVRVKKETEKGIKTIKESRNGQSKF